MCVCEMRERSSVSSSWVVFFIQKEDEDEDDQGQEGKEAGDASSGSGTRSGDDDADVGRAVVPNLCAMVEYLVRERGAHVCLCTLPLVGAPSSMRARAVAGVNRRILAMAARSVRDLRCDFGGLDRWGRALRGEGVGRWVV